MSYLSQNGIWSTSQLPMTSQAGVATQFRTPHQQPESQAWIPSSVPSHSFESTNSPMPSSSLSHSFDPNAFRMPPFANIQDPGLAAPFAALLQQQQSMNNFEAQNTWQNLQQHGGQHGTNIPQSLLPGFPAGMQSVNGGSQPFTSISQSTSSMANFPMLLSANDITASPSSIGRKSPVVTNPAPGITFGASGSPALMNSIIGRNTSQSNSLVGTPSDGSIHSSDVGMQSNAMSSTNDQSQTLKTKRSSVGGSTAGTHRRIKFRRSRTGCLVCRKRKVKCDQDGLPCKQCRFGKRDCHYEENPLPKRRRKSTVSAVHSNENGDVEKRQAGSKGKLPSRSLNDKSIEQQSVGQTSVPNQVAPSHSRRDDQAKVSQQALFEKLRQAACHPSLLNLAEYGSNYGGDDESKESSEHWASTGSTFSGFHGGGDGEWNSTTPSTGATSFQTVDGELLGSNSSSRRVTLSDDRFDQFDFSSGTINPGGNQSNIGGIDIFSSGFAAHQPSSSDAEQVISLLPDRKTSLSPLHMDALHNRLSSNFDPNGLSNRPNFHH